MPEVPQSPALAALLAALGDATGEAGSLVLDATSLGTHGSPLLQVLALLGLASLSLSATSLPAALTDDTLTLTGLDGPIPVTITFSDDGSGELAVEALWQASAPTALATRFGAGLPQGFFGGVHPAGSTTTIDVSPLPAISMSNATFGVLGVATPQSGLYTPYVAPQVEGDVAVSGGSRRLYAVLRTAITGHRLRSGDGAAWSFDDLGAILPGAGVVDVLTPLFAGSFELAAFTLTLWPDAAPLSSLLVTIESPGDAGPLWSALGGKIVLSDIRVSLGFSDAWGLSGQGYIHGDIVVGTIPLAVEIPFPLTGVWSISSRPDVALPSLDDLATLVSLQSLDELLPAGLGQIGAFTLTYIRIAASPSALQEFTVALTSTSPWSLLPGNGVELASLRIRFTIDASKAVSARVSGTFELGASEVLVDFGRDFPSDPWRLSVFSPAIALPSLGAMSNLVPGVDLSTAIQAAGLDKLHFVIQDLRLGISLTPPETTPTLENVGMTVSLADAQDPLSAALDWEVFPGVLTLTDFSVGFNIDAIKKTADVKGTFTANGLTFTVGFGRGPSQDAFAAAYRHDGESGNIDLKQVIATFSDEVAALVPDDVVIDIADALLLYRGDGAKTGKFFFAMDIGASFSLADLPLVGEHLPEDVEVAVKDLRIIVASEAFSAADVGSLAPILTELAVTPLPAQDVGKGVTIAAALQIGGLTASLTIPLVAGPADSSATKDQSSASSPALESATPTTADALAPPASQAEAGAKWFSLDKNLGPVTFRRVGVQYQESTLFFLLDVAVALGGLNVALSGLGIGSPLTSFAPTAHLDGAAVTFLGGPVTLDAGLLHVPTASLPPGVDDEYLGAVTIGFTPWEIAGVAAYARVTGASSFFAFAQVKGDFGGPPAFFVTGLMGGFGYNSRLTLPAPDQVYRFPFIAGLDDPTLFGAKPTPISVMNALTGAGGSSPAWVTPSVGDLWLAGGVIFRTYELILGRVLVTAVFGEKLQIALLGLASVSLPQAASADAYAFVELQLAAIFDPTDGHLTIAGSLTPTSFVIAKECRLTGGFAFDLWFGESPHAGDFVLTLGGYHPAFARPAWYPTPARVGLNWPVDAQLSIKGGVYCALTPSSVMAGGDLEVLFQTATVKAWFIANANLVMQWKPFHFTADIAVRLGAAVTLKLWITTLRFSFEISSCLTMWGPPTSGVVRVNLSILSFDIRFGGSAPRALPPPLPWSELVTLLPCAQDGQATAPSDDVGGADILKIQINAGLAGESDDGGWIVRVDALSITISTPVPLTGWVLGSGAAPALAAGAQRAEFPGSISIRPMATSEIASTLRVNITRLEDGTDLDLHTWTQTPQSAALSAALWGEPLPPGTAPPANAETIPGLPVGVRLDAPPSISAEGSLGPADLSNLGDHVADGLLPLDPHGQVDPIPPPHADASAVSRIAEVAGSPDAQRAQTTMLAALAARGACPPTTAPLVELAREAGKLFAQPPLIAS